MQKAGPRLCLRPRPSAPYPAPSPSCRPAGRVHSAQGLQPRCVCVSAPGPEQTGLSPVGSSFPGLPLLPAPSPYWYPEGGTSGPALH